MIESDQLGQELRVFIDLLQNQQLPGELRHKNGSLSVIHSASEHDSSSLDKENVFCSNNSQKSTTHEVDRLLTTAFPKHSLTTQQQKAIDEMRQRVATLSRQIELKDARISALESQLGTEKTNSNELLGLLKNMKEAEAEMWSNYEALQSKNYELETALSAEAELLNTSESRVESLQSDRKFMQQMLLLANENFEELQREYSSMLQSCPRRPLQQYSAEKITENSIKKPRKKLQQTKEKEKSPRMSQIGYQRLIMKTLAGRSTHPRPG